MGSRLMCAVRRLHLSPCSCPQVRTVLRDVLYFRPERKYLAETSTEHGCGLDRPNQCSSFVSPHESRLIHRRRRLVTGQDFLRVIRKFMIVEARCSSLFLLRSARQLGQGKSDKTGALRGRATPRNLPGTTGGGVSPRATSQT